MIKNLLVASAVTNVFLITAMYLLIGGHVIIEHQMHDIIAAAEMATKGSK